MTWLPILTTQFLSRSSLYVPVILLAAGLVYPFLWAFLSLEIEAVSLDAPASTEEAVMCWHCCGDQNLPH